MTKAKVLVAMSGGVDSSVAAALLKEQGYQVTGVTIKLWPRYIDPVDGGGCCSLAAVEDARRVARVLDIPYYVLNMQEQFQQQVIDKFASEYRRGRTPNPCIECNRAIKFGRLLDKAAQLGMDFVATGHYARIGRDSEGVYRLYRGRDQDKDQSYTLYSLNQSTLRKVLFPLGEYRKEEVRALARKFGLGIASKPDSQEICFVPDNDYKAFLTRHAGMKQQPGPIVDTEGTVLGEHRGIFNYTIGQRRGLGIAAGKPLYVVDIRPQSNTVVVGENSQVYSRTCLVADFNWVAGVPAREFAAQVMIRYNAQPQQAVVRAMPDGVEVTFAQPQRAVTPGQSAVVYQQDLVLGGGIIIARSVD